MLYLGTAAGNGGLPEGLAGAALLLGFLAMLLLDQLQGDTHVHKHRPHLHVSSSDDDAEDPLAAQDRTRIRTQIATGTVSKPTLPT